MTSDLTTTEAIWQKIGVSDPYWKQVHLILAERELQIRRAREHPAFLLQHVRCVDSRSGDIFNFTLLTEDECRRIGAEYRGDDWYWQRDYLDWCLDNKQTITLKGRQLGVTWVWAGIALWTALFKPGSDILVYSIKEGDASEVIGRIWDMWVSLPDHFKEGITVIKPTRGVRPTTKIEFEHPDGRVSAIEGMVATESAGHGRSAALVLFDEASRQEYARSLWKAVIPASGDKGGMIGVISTANGSGDFFHELWKGAGGAAYPNLQKKFLGWFLHPERDEVWYDHVPLDESSKAEQYPNTPEEAFLLSGSPYFGSAALKFYAQEANRAKPLYKMEWLVDPNAPNRATQRRGQGWIEVYKEPQPGHKYAMGADIATGVGSDFSVGAVIDLGTGEPCAEVYMKGSYEDFAAQIHFTGLWYRGGANMPACRIGPELGGGYGDTVIAYLRDGHKGRKPYPMLYRHRGYETAGRKQTPRFGFPMNMKTRPKVVSGLREWIDKHLFPYMPEGLLGEAMTFVHRSTRPTPRAEDGCNDDRVMAWGIATELYSEFGEHEYDRKKTVVAKFKQKKPPTPVFRY